MSAVASIDVVLHRLLWPLASLTLLLTAVRRWRWLHDSRQWWVLATVAVSSLVLFANWLVFARVAHHDSVLRSCLSVHAVGNYLNLWGFTR